LIRRSRKALDGLADDLRDHIERQTEENLARGMTPEEAHRQARLALGNPALIEEDTRAVWVWRWLEDLRRDLRASLRYVRNRRGLTLLVTSTLAIAIASTTTVYTLADALLWRPVPFHDADRLVRLRGFGEVGGANPVWALQQDANRTPFSGIYAFGLASAIVEVSGQAEAVTTGTIAPGVLGALGVSPLWGRDFTPQEAATENRVVLASAGLWDRLKSSGQIAPHVAVDGQPYTVIGALPPGFEFPVSRVMLWRPYAPAPAAGQIAALGILKAGVSREQAQAYAATIAPANAARGAAWLQVGPLVATIPLTQLALRVLLGAAAVLLLVAVANVANVLVADGTRRDAEFAIRKSLGASNIRIARQILFETLLLAVIAVAAGIALTIWVMSFVRNAIPYLLMFQALRPIAVDVRGFAFAGMVAAGSAFAAATLVIARRRNGRLEDVLRAQGSGGARRNRVRAALVVAQIAVSFVLVAAAALLARSLVRIAAVDPGFDASHVTAVTVEIPQYRYKNDQAVRQALESVKTAALALPGVTNATVVKSIPPGFSTRNLRGLETPSVNETGDTPVSYARVDDQFFATLRVPVLAGRAFTTHDSANSVPVAVVSRALATRWWPAGDAIGQRFRESPIQPWRTVVGVVGNVRSGSFEQPASPYTYYTPVGQENAVWWFNNIAVRSDNQDVAPALRDIVTRLMPGAPIMETLSGDEAVANAYTRVRFSALLVIVLAAVTLSLAVVGVFAGSWQSVEERRREIGIRIAMGATPTALVQMVLGRTALAAAIGLAIGVPAALASTRSLTALLFSVSPTDPLILGVAALGLSAAAIAAAYLPARRAATVDAVQAIKAQ
jgi:putative ABC transport system permease protein